MPDIKISDLSAATSASGAMQVEVNDSGTSKHITVDQVKAYVLPDDSITSAKIAADAVGSSEIASGAVGSTELADGSVTPIKMGTGTFSINTSGFADSLSTTSWTVSETATELLFKFGGVNKAKLDSSGNLIVVGNVTAFGTI